MALMLDPACHIRTFADAVAVGRACDEAGFRWYEDPYRDSGVSAFGHKKLRELIRTPLLQTEHVRGIEPKADFILAGGTDLLRADLEYDLGITGTMKIAHLAEALGPTSSSTPRARRTGTHGGDPQHQLLQVALVGPRARNPLPPVYASDYSDDLEGVGADGCFPVPDRPRPRRHLRLGLDRKAPHGDARVPGKKRLMNTAPRCVAAPSARCDAGTQGDSVGLSIICRADPQCDSNGDPCQASCRELLPRRAINPAGEAEQPSPPLAGHRPHAVRPAR